MAVPLTRLGRILWRLAPEVRVGSSAGDDA
jgi:hypothetical protein